jgi:hypothetical protein
MRRILPMTFGDLRCFGRSKIVARQDTNTIRIDIGDDKKESVQGKRL